MNQFLTTEQLNELRDIENRIARLRTSLAGPVDQKLSATMPVQHVIEFFLPYTQNGYGDFSRMSRGAVHYLDRYRQIEEQLSEMTGKARRFLDLCNLTPMESDRVDHDRVRGSAQAEVFNAAMKLARANF